MTAQESGRWRAPHARSPIDATVRLPGSKSITNRALILAALADGISTLRRPLHARDTDLMAEALRRLGTRVDEYGDDWFVNPVHYLKCDAEIDCGLAGTVMRFVPPVAALVDGETHFDGDPRARERPMDQLISALRTLGARVNDGGRGTLPFTVGCKGSMRGGVVTIDASASSQFVSGLLLAAARYDEGIDLRHNGKSLPSQPHIDMTISMLRERGVSVDTAEPNRWVVAPGPVKPLDVDVEPDLSQAAPFLAAALVTGGRVAVPGWPQHTDQAGDRLREILQLWGARSALTADALTVEHSGPIEPVDLDLHDVGELTPVIAAVCALAGGRSRLRGIAHLRGHETDRLAALATELNALGGDARQTEDGLEITPRPLHAGVFHTYADHRMAHAAAVLGLAVEGVDVDDIATTSKTFPEFADVWESLLP